MVKKAKRPRKKADEWNKPVPAKVIADMLGISSQRVGQLVAREVFKRSTAGQYRLKETILAFIRYKRLGDQTDAEIKSFEKERARLTSVRADIAEVERDRLIGKSIDMDLVAEVWRDILLPSRAAWLAFPTKVTPQVHGKSRQEIKATLEEEVHQILENVAASEIVYDPDGPPPSPED